MSTASMPDVAALDDEAQALVDARLDTIERMLAGRTTRGDRLAIVREVEAQVQDLLANRAPGEPDRDAVIAALAHLDPPEAFLAEGAGAASPGHLATPAAARPIARPRGASPASTTGKISAGVGLAGLLSYHSLVILNPHLSRGPIEPVRVLTMLPPLLAVINAQATAAIGFAAYSRFASRWAIAGASLGVLTAALCGIGPFLMLLR